jgi:hypothetical protein
VARWRWWVFALAADKGALCLTMSALDELSDTEFSRMTPSLFAIFSKRGWLALLWGIVLLPLGFGVQAIALLTSGRIARWQSLLFLLGAVFIATPDGIEIVNLTATEHLAFRCKQPANYVAICVHEIHKGKRASVLWTPAR